MLIRKALSSDAEAIVQFLYQLDNETKFMLLEKGERQTTVEQQKERLEGVEKSEREVMLVAISDDKAIGLVTGIGGNFRRNRHSLHIIIGVLKAFAGKGIGKQLMVELETWALNHNFHRLELTVMAHNERAIKLYLRCGFEQEGVKRDSLLVEGAYVDELYMAKLI